MAGASVYKATNITNFLRKSGIKGSIVVSTAATNQTGQEGAILRFVFWHSVALACIMGVIVMLQAYVFSWVIPVPR